MGGEGSSNEPIRYSLRLPEELWNRLDKIKEKLHSKSLHSLIIEALVFYLVEQEKKLGITKEEPK